MNTATLHTDASANGVNAVVETLNGDFGAFSRNAGNAAQLDDTVDNLWNFLFEQAAQEIGRGTRKEDLRISV